MELFRDEETKLPLDILLRRSRLPIEGHYESTLARTIGTYPSLAEPIVVHGDTWPKNIIVKYDGSDVMFIDWELAGPGYRGQDAARTLWGLTLDRNWHYVGINDNGHAFIEEWCKSESDRGSLRFGILFESLRWIADRQDSLQSPVKDNETAQKLVSEIEGVKNQALEYLVHIK